MTVRNLQHIALAVPDASVGERFYTEFGMEARDQGNRIAMRCLGREQDQVILLDGPKKAMHHISFGTREQEFGELKQRLEKNAVKLLDAPKETPGEGLWFRDPDGLLVNVKIAEPTPWRTAPDWKINSPGNLNRAGTPGHPKRDHRVHPTRLGHVLRFTPQMDTMLDFYTRIVGLRLSDRAQDIVAFMRGQGGSDHHIFGFIKSDKPGHHHSSFEVSNIDEIGIGACNLLDKGYANGWGFGRHVIGSNFFHYVRDPWNSLAEYFCDIDYIPGDCNWEAKNYPPEDSLYVWGPKTPEDFGFNFEARG
jgi:catechol 2,3-dioxygenase-like lactoylglutathione lyase family enzyme